MIKEELNSICNNNQEELNQLEQKMKKLMEDLHCGQEWVKSVQKEQDSEDTIFSPRIKQDEKQKELENAQRNLTEIKNEIENTRNSMEAIIIKKNKSDKMAVIIQDIYDRANLCLTYLNKDQTKCRNELEQIKNEIEKYVEEIEK